MRIGLVATEYITEKNYAGGIANYLHRFALGLTAKGHEVEIFVLSDRNEQLTHDGLLVHRVRSKEWLKSLLKFKFPKAIKTLIDAKTLRNAVIKRHKEKYLDILQVQNYASPGFYLVKDRMIPVVTRVSSFAPVLRAAMGEHANFDTTLTEKLEVMQMRLSDGLYAPSEIVKKHIELCEPIQVAHILPPFVPHTAEDDESRFIDYKGGSDYLLFFGSMMKSKGIEFLLRNLEEILRQNPRINFIFIGRFGNEGEVKKAAGSMSDRAHYFDSMLRSQLNVFVKKARAIILPSIIDNLPNTCLESMALGKVVLTTETSGFKGIIHSGKNGFLIEYGNDSEFQDIIKNINEFDKNTLEKIGQNAKTTISNQFSPENNVDNVINYFKSVVNKEVIV